MARPVASSSRFTRAMTPVLLSNIPAVARQTRK